MLDPYKDGLADFLGPDGLPYIGLKLSKGTPYYRYVTYVNFLWYHFLNKRYFFFFSYFDEQIQGFVVVKYIGSEEVIVDSVRLCGDFTTGRKIPNKATITIRVQVC